MSQLDDSLAKWGSRFVRLSLDETIDGLLHELEVAAAEHPLGPRKAVMSYQHPLAAAFYNERANASWLQNVEEAVRRLSSDDYHSYREMALAWIASAVLCHENDVQARQALGAVLVGALGVPEPGFCGEMVVAALQGLAQETGQTLKTDGLVDALKCTGSTIKEPTLASLRVEANLRPDPWAFELLSRSAVAEALHRQGQQAQAESVLEEVGQLGWEGSYADYRLLARLSLACRWLEWGRSDKATALLALARKGATDMLDKVLGHEREGLVDALERWLADLQDHVPELVDAGTALRHTGDLTGMMRSLHIQFLAALWSEQPEHLKRLVPLTLSDTTAMDAVLGRLFAQWSKEERADQPFRRLAREMHIEHLERQFITGT